MSSGFAMASTGEPPVQQDNLVGYDQSLRPQFHFTARTGHVWDACGMLYYEGEWHMCPGWRNAVSTDLMHWTQLPDALTNYPNVIWNKGKPHHTYSGSAVVDELNVLGKQAGDVKTFFAVFTATHEGEDNKAAYFQAGAYSTDKGRTWTLLNGGRPIIPHQTGFDPEQRDPYIFYHAASKSYIIIMMVDGKDHAVRLFRSTDLLHWQTICDIPKKSMECMNMFPIPVDGDPRNMKWIIADALTDYEIGDFDGTTWTGFEKGKRRRFDLGDCYYAAQVFNHAPDHRVIHVGCLQSTARGQAHRYSPFTEAGMPFIHQMSIPAEITLRTTPEGIRMYRNPVKEIAGLYCKTDKFENLSIETANAKLATLKPELIDMTIAFVAAGDLTLNVRGLKINYDAAKKEFNFTNTARVEGEKAAILKLPPDNRQPYRDTGRRAIPAPEVDGKVKLRVLVDRASLELFVNDGQAAASFTVIPAADKRTISIDGNASMKLDSLVVNELRSIWSQN